MLIIELIGIVIVGILIGYSAHYICKGVDNWMDYGSIFYLVRLEKFKRICGKYGYTDLLERAEKVNEYREDDTIPFTSHISYMSKLFWELADRHHPFKLWVCVECMSIRYVLYVSLLAVILICFYLNSAWYLLSLPLINAAAITTIYRVNG